MIGGKCIKERTRRQGAGPVLFISMMILMLCAALHWAHQAQAESGEKILYVENGEENMQYLATVNPDGTGAKRVSSGYFLIVAPRCSQATGAIVFTVQDEMVKSSVHIHYPDSSPEKIIDNAFAHCWSPDGKSILYSPSGSQCDLYRYSVAAKSSERLTKGKMVNEACWSSDGKRIALSVMEKDSSLNLYLYTLQGASLEKLTNTPGASEHSPNFTPDGKSLIYCHQPFEGLAGCKPGWLARLEVSSKKATPLPVKDAYSPSLSADGQWIVFEDGNETSRIALCRLDGSSLLKLPVNGAGPAWMK